MTQPTGNQPAPGSKPWERKWSNPPSVASTSPQVTVDKNKKPWQRVWNEVTGRPGHTAPKTFALPAPVGDLRTEKAALKAMIIQPYEVQPDTMTPEQNIQLIKTEIKNTPHEEGRQILREQLAKFERMKGK